MDSQHKPDGDRENYVRFNFKELKDSAINIASFDCLVDAVRTVGPVCVAAVKVHLVIVDEEGL
jgi:hypothetical protein